MKDPKHNQFDLNPVVLIVEVGIWDSEDIVEWDARPIIAA